MSVFSSDEASDDSSSDGSSMAGWVENISVNIQLNFGGKLMKYLFKKENFFFFLKENLNVELSIFLYGSYLKSYYIWGHR